MRVLLATTGGHEGSSGAEGGDGDRDHGGVTGLGELVALGGLITILWLMLGLDLRLNRIGGVWAGGRGGPPPNPPRHYDEAFKRQIVQSCESGKPSREIGAEYDIARSTLRRWVQDIRDRRLEMEADVSEQAAPVFTRRQA